MPLSYRYKLKVVTLVYKGLNSLAPSYISSMLNHYEPKTSMCIRSVEAKHLEVPFIRFSVYKRAFSVNGPKLKSVQYLPKLLISNNQIPTVKIGESFEYLGRYFDFDMSLN